MAKSPSIDIDPKSDLISYEVIIGGEKLEKYSGKGDDSVYIYSVEINLEINRVPTAEIYILDGSLHDPVGFNILDEKKSKFVPGEKVEIKAGYHQKNETVFKGIVSKTGIRLKDRSHTLIFVEATDKAVKMTLNRNNEYYLEKKDTDIIKTLISNHGLQTGKITTTDVKHKEIIQYNTTDWDFMVSRSEVNGRIILIEEEKINVIKPTEGAETPLELTLGRDFNKANLVIDGHTQLSKVRCASWDMTEQKIIEKESKEPSDIDNKYPKFGKLRGKKLGDEFAKKTHNLHLTGPIPKEELKAWADAKLIKSRLSKVRGTVTFQGNAEVKPNSFITIKDTGEFFEGEIYVTRVNHHLREGNWLTEVGVGLSPDWFVESKPNIQSASASALLPGIEGLYNGVVKKIHDDPDGDTRILVDVPVIKPSGDGVWARIANFYASNKAGSFFMPEEKDEVVLGFLNNDPRFPVILGSLYSKKKETPDDHEGKEIVPDKDNSVKAIVTKNKLKIIFEDKDKNLIIETPDERRIRISDQDDEITITDKNNRNEIIMDDKGITIRTQKDIKMEAPRGKIEITAMRDVTIDGMNVKAKAKNSIEASGTTAKLKGTGSTNVESSGMTTVKGSIVTIN